MRKLGLFALALGALFNVACSSDDNSSSKNDLPKGEYSNGYFVINEGNFGAGNSEISFISDDLMQVENKIFGANNDNEALGDTAQSLYIHDDLAYIILNASETVQIVNRHSFEKIAEITYGLENPRYIAVEGSYAYITNWGDPSDKSDDYVAVVDLNTHTVVEKIDVDYGPEKILAHNGKLYVTHLGGWTEHNLLSIIDAATHTLEKELEVGDKPTAMAVVSNNLWVLSAGNPSYAAGGETNSSLEVVDLGSQTVTKSFDFDSNGAGSLTYSDNNFYYVVSSTDWETYETQTDVFKMSATAESLPTEALMSSSITHYGLAIYDGYLFLGDAKDYASNGDLLIYDLNSSELVAKHEVGISPNGIYSTK